MYRDSSIRIFPEYEKSFIKNFGIRFGGRKNSEGLKFDKQACFHWCSALAFENCGFVQLFTHISEDNKNNDKNLLVQPLSWNINV